MRNQLEAELINVIAPFRNILPFEEIKAQITIILSDYEVASRKTEIAIRSEDKNQKYIMMFLAAKAAGGRTDKTLHCYRSYLVKIFDSIGKDVDEITPEDIKLYLAKKLRVDKIKKTSVDNERRALSTFYGWMHNNEYIARNPMHKVEVMKFSKPKKKAFTDIEVEKIRDACETEREQMIVETLLSTWCRVSEISMIKREEIEDDKILVHGKGEKDRIVFLNAKAQLAISKYLEKRSDSNPYLLPKMISIKSMSSFRSGMTKLEMKRWYESPEFIDGNLPGDNGTIERIVRELGKRAGVSNVHPHRFRRTGATFALRAGMPLITVSKLLGHANIAVTQVYLDITDDELESAHEKYVR